MEIPKLSDADIREAARELVVDCFGSVSPSLPVDLDEIIYEHLYPRDNLVFWDEEDLGLDEGGDEILGKMIPRRGRILVTSRLKGDRNKGRYRFTVAHEIGHWTLHRPYFLASLDEPSLFGSTVDPDEAVVSYRRSVFPAGAGYRLSRQEYQANRFAIALLAEPEALRKQMEARFGVKVMYRQSAPTDLRRSTLDEFAAAVGSSARNGLPPLNELFGLSKQAMGIGLKEFGFVSEVVPLL